MNTTVDSTVVEHDTLAVIVTIAGVALLMASSSGSGGFLAAASRLVVAVLSGA